MIRKIFAVFIGYLFFAVSSGLLFFLLSIDPSQDIDIAKLLFITFIGGVFAIISGFLTKKISNSNDKRVIGILSFVIALIALMSILDQPETAHWSQLIAIFILAPLSYLGGLNGTRRSSK